VAAALVSSPIHADETEPTPDADPPMTPGTHGLQSDDTVDLSDLPGEVFFIELLNKVAGKRVDDRAIRKRVDRPSR